MIGFTSSRWLSMCIRTGLLVGLLLVGRLAFSQVTAWVDMDIFHGHIYIASEIGGHEG